MKTIFKFIVLVCVSCSVYHSFAQEHNNNISMIKHSPFWRIDLSADYAYSKFHASDLSILSRNPQQILYGNNSLGFNGRFVVFDHSDFSKLRTAMFLGFDFQNSDIPLTDENIKLQSYSLLFGFMIEVSRIVSLGFGFGFGFGRYDNNYSLLGKSYIYKNNGLLGKVESTAFFSVQKYVQIGFGLEYEMYTFKDNDLYLPNNLPSQLPSTNKINSIKPFISLRVSI